MKNKYVEFEKQGEEYVIWNIIYNQRVGVVRKERMGTWMHWQLFGDDGVGFSNGCLKEISPFITSLYRKERKPK